MGAFGNFADDAWLARPAIIFWITRMLGSVEVASASISLRRHTPRLSGTLDSGAAVYRPAQTHGPNRRPRHLPHADRAPIPQAGVAAWLCCSRSGLQGSLPNRTESVRAMEGMFWR